MRLIGYLIVNTAALLITAYLIPGFIVENLQTAVISALVIGTINTFIKPILKLITFPITILTLGVFSLFLNVMLLYLATSFVIGFTIESFTAAIIGSIVLSLISSFLGMLTK